MKSARRVAERMIVERAARAHAIAKKLRNLAGQLESYDSRTAGSIGLDAAAGELRESADQVERL